MGSVRLKKGTEKEISLKTTSYNDVIRMQRLFIYNIMTLVPHMLQFCVLTTPSRVKICASSDHKMFKDYALSTTILARNILSNSVRVSEFAGFSACTTDVNRIWIQLYSVLYSGTKERQITWRSTFAEWYWEPGAHPTTARPTSFAV